MTRWRYEFIDDLGGKAEFAWVYAPNGDVVCTTKTQHAFAIVGGMNNVDFLSTQLSHANATIADLKANLRNEGAIARGEGCTVTRHNGGGE